MLALYFFGLAADMKKETTLKSFSRAASAPAPHLMLDGVDGGKKNGNEERGSWSPVSLSDVGFSTWLDFGFGFGLAGEEKITSTFHPKYVAPRPSNSYPKIKDV